MNDIVRFSTLALAASALLPVAVRAMEKAPFDPNGSAIDSAYEETYHAVRASVASQKQAPSSPQAAPGAGRSPDEPLAQILFWGASGSPSYDGDCDGAVARMSADLDAALVRLGGNPGDATVKKAEVSREERACGGSGEEYRFQGPLPRHCSTSMVSHCSMLLTSNSRFRFVTAEGPEQDSAPSMACTEDVPVAGSHAVLAKGAASRYDEAKKLIVCSARTLNLVDPTN